MLCLSCGLSEGNILGNGHVTQVSILLVCTRTVCVCVCVCVCMGIRIWVWDYLRILIFVLLHLPSLHTHMHLPPPPPHRWIQCVGACRTQWEQTVRSACHYSMTDHGDLGMGLPPVAKVAWSYLWDPVRIQTWVLWLHAPMLDIYSHET